MKKIESRIITIVIILSFILSPLYKMEAIGPKELNWNSPNTSNGNPFKFKLQDSLNSNMIMSVIGCTGIVNKISSAVTGFVQDQVNDAVDYGKELLQEKITKAGVDIGLGITAGTATSPGSQAGTGLADIGEGAAQDVVTKKTNDKKAVQSQNNTTKELKTEENTNNCLNGIAYTLAKNQLTAMTKSTMNWVTSGFGGDPMYVRDMDSFMNDITSSILEKEVSLYRDVNLYPYGNNYGRSAISSYKAQQSFSGSIQQTLTNYLNFGGLGNDAAGLITGNNNNANRYYNNFAAGGWDGWLAFTQMPQNNPLGFSISLSQEILNKQTSKAEQTKTELVTNKGVLDQKKCVSSALTSNSAINNIAASQEAADSAYNDAVNAYNRAEADYSSAEYDPTRVNELPTLGAAVDAAYTAMEDAMYVTNISPDGKKDECTQWEVVTPGSVIQDKISTYINSPERQLELADTINKSLNSLFTSLIGKLQDDGLSGLNSNSTDLATASGGVGRNKVFDNTGADISGKGLPVSTGAGFSGAFDITKDLGNIYVTPSNSGDWDASKNLTTNKAETSLSKGLGTKNTYYVVSVAGTKSLFEGNTSWSVGELAFFDGTDWKKGVPEYALDKKGILQIQQDYINNAQKVLKILPKVMPAIGELDYCIPGPNPSWQSNSADAYTAYINWLYGITTDDKAKTFGLSDLGLVGTVLGSTPLGWGFNASGVGQAKTRIWIPEMQTSEYKNYAKIFDGTGLFQKVKDSIFFNSYTLDPSFYSRDWDHPFDRINHSCGVAAILGSETWWKGDSCIGSAKHVINAGQQKWVDWIDRVSLLYQRYVNDKYWSNTTDTSLNNPGGKGYLEMAQTGLAVTKNIVNYDQSINAATTKYQDGIVESCSNLYKLNKIKEQVNIIVKAAQARRKSLGITVDESCTQTELGTYLYNGKVMLKGCGNTILDDSIQIKTAKELMPDALAQLAASEAATNAQNSIYDLVNGAATNNQSTITATPTYPGVSNLLTSSITFNSATFSAVVISTGYPTTILDRGICYYISGRNPSNAICVSSTSDPLSTGFSSTLSLLTPNTTYYYNAYADNATGRGVTPWFTFTTPAQ